MTVKDWKKILEGLDDDVEIHIAGCDGVAVVCRNKWRGPNMLEIDFNPPLMIVPDEPGVEPNPEPPHGTK